MVALVKRMLTHTRSHPCPLSPPPPYSHPPANPPASFHHSLHTPISLACLPSSLSSTLPSSTHIHTFTYVHALLSRMPACLDHPSSPLI